MTTRSSVLAWRSPWTGEPGGHTESDRTEAEGETLGDPGKMAVYTARTGASEEANLAGSWILDFWLPEL